MMKKVALLIVISWLFSSCIELPGTNSNKSEPSPKFYGAWAGYLNSSVGNGEKYVIVAIDGDAIYYADAYGDTGIGKLTKRNDRYFASLVRYSSFPVRTDSEIKNPAIGYKSEKTLSISLDITKEKITSQYDMVENGSISDTGSITLLAYVPSSENPSRIGVTGTYDSHSFLCGNDGPSPVSCVSHVKAAVDSDLHISGEYSDNTPHSFLFTGGVSKLNSSLYSVTIILPNYGKFSGIGWYPENSAFVFITQNDSLIFRIL